MTRPWRMSADWWNGTEGWPLSILPRTMCCGSVEWGFRAGMMGTAIAAAHVLHQMPVVLCDLDEEVLAKRRPLSQRKFERRDRFSRRKRSVP